MPNTKTLKTTHNSSCESIRYKSLQSINSALDLQNDVQGLSSLPGTERGGVRRVRMQDELGGNCAGDYRLRGSYEFTTAGTKSSNRGRTRPSVQPVRTDKVGGGNLRGDFELV